MPDTNCVIVFRVYVVAYFRTSYHVLHVRAYPICIRDKHAASSSHGVRPCVTRVEMMCVTNQGIHFSVWLNVLLDNYIFCTDATIVILTFSYHEINLSEFMKRSKNNTSINVFTLYVYAPQQILYCVSHLTENADLQSFTFTGLHWYTRTHEHSTFTMYTWFVSSLLTIDFLFAFSDDVWAYIINIRSRLLSSYTYICTSSLIMVQHLHDWK